MELQLSESNILGTVLAFILSLFLVPLAAAYSKKNGLMDEPGGRKIHTHPTSRLGGAAVWMSAAIVFACVLLLAHYPHRKLLSGLMLGSSLMFLLGLIDDIYNLSAKFKFVVQISAASIAFCLGIKISALFIPFFGLIELPAAVSYIITIGWITGISNAVNFIDGLDGLAGSVIALSSAALGIAAALSGNSAGSLAAFILTGSILGFLAYNFYPAKIFMGDSGALFSGFILAALSIMHQMKANDMSMYLPVLILAAPILDITYSSLRRIFKGISPFTADAGHIHHRLIKAGLSQNQTVLIISVFSAAAGAAAVFLTDMSAVKYFIYAIVLSSVMIILNRFAKYERKNIE